MTSIIIEEKNFCQYCKRPIENDSKGNSHKKCEKLIKHYNNRIITNIRKKILLNNNLKKKIKWEKNKNLVYTIIYSVGGINVLSIIIIYSLLFGIK